MASGTKPARWKSAPASPEQSTSAESTPSPRISSLTATGNRILLRDLQSSRHESQSEIPLRIAEAAQDWGSRRYHAGVPLPTVTQELGHESLAAAEDYLVHVKKAETKKAVADADFIPKLKVQDCKDEY